MAGSVNKVILIGNLGADPEIKSFQNGGKIANIRIATSPCCANSRHTPRATSAAVINSVIA